MKEIIKEIIEFRNRRGWQKNDTPEAFAKSIIIEAAELLENFQWGSEPKNIENVKEELADVLTYALAMVYDMGWDVDEIIREKLEKNLVKYPEPKNVEKK